MVMDYFVCNVSGKKMVFAFQWLECEAFGLPCLFVFINNSFAR